MEPGGEGWEELVDYMRQDLDSGMALTKVEMTARKILEEQGRDFEQEFKEWRKKRHAYGTSST